MKRARSGFTLVELLVTTSLLGIVLGSALVFTVSSERLYRDASVRGLAQAKARRVLERVVSELAFADRDSFLPGAVGDSGTNDLRFNCIESVAVDVAVFGVTMRLWRQQSPTDPDDGVDNDGNGSIDEGRLVLVRDDGGAAQKSIVLVSNVRELFEGEVLGNLVDENDNGATDESGFFVRRDGNLLTLGISIQEPAPDGTSVSGSASTTLALRN